MPQSCAPRPAGIVLPSLDNACVKRSSSRSSNASGTGGESPPTGAAEDGGGGGGASRAKPDVVDAIASGMRSSGMQPGVVRPPAMVTGACGGRRLGGGCWVRVAGGHVTAPQRAQPGSLEGLHCS